ncbi:hypothetical protein GCM10012289_76320 [Nonomuraea cavernae]|uniref:Uncharacterized protein n=1 Tax=Nonomuraea cavernae TaxID=2045107 RepID=A0A917ZIP2_9ACTN|nr:hypothetical protein GCM10012289_76320 [Nonomuraea cavernae]
MAALGSMPQRQMPVSFECRTSGVRRHYLSGPLLIDVIGSAGPRFEGDRCGARHVSQVTDIRVCADDRPISEGGSVQRTGRPVTARPMISRWISDVPSKMV